MAESEINVQDVFNKVIGADYYPREWDTQTGDNYMCNAVFQAALDGYITNEEKDAAHKAIQNYLSGYVYLSSKLDGMGYPIDIQARLAIYKDWEKRPFIKPPEMQ